MSSSPEFKWEHYLDLADELAASQAAGEARLRSAISRAYYAAFHVAMRFLQDNRQYTPTLSGKDHGNVWRIYKTGPGTGIERRQIGNRGFQLLRDREQADYRVPLASSKDSAWKAAEFALLNAKYIVASVNGIRTRMQAKLGPQSGDSTSTGTTSDPAGPEQIA